MNAEVYQQCDLAVIGVVAYVMGGNQDDQVYVMEAMEKAGVTPEWFHDLRHQRFFEAVYAYWKKEHALDTFLIMKEFQGTGVQEFTNTVEEGLAQGSQMCHLEYYLYALREKHIYAMAHRLMTETMHDLSPDNIGVQLECFVKKMHELQEDMAEGDDKLKQLEYYVKESVEKKRKLHEERFVNHNWEYLDGLRWPWKELDMIYSGLKTGLHIVAALASQGKSTMAADLSVFWNERGIKHGFFSIDMAADQLADRYPCIMNRVSLAKLNFGASAEEVTRFERGFARAVKLNNVWLSEVDDAKIMEYQCYRGVKTLGWQAIIVDYIQLVHSDDKGQVPEYTRVQHAVQAIKGVAKKLKVPIICLAQLSRAFEKDLREKGFAPGLDAIGDSAEIARAAASVMCIYQDEDVKNYWKETPPVKLAFADPDDAAYRAEVMSAADEDEETATARRAGQVSLAKQLRPVWIDVKKNQQGRCGKVPFVMFPNYFLFRPGNSDEANKKEEVTIGGKTKQIYRAAFEQIRDDWTYTEQDWWLEMTGAMPQRGVKLMGETIEQMHQRMAREREEHPEVAHFEWVNGRGYKTEAKADVADI